jgi:hypothetical protein
MPDAVWIAALLVLALVAILYAAHKRKPETFKLSASFVRLFTFTLEMTTSLSRRRDDDADEERDLDLNVKDR